MQLKYGFKKEWLHFTRSFRFGGMLICIFSFAIANPLLYKALIALAEMMEQSEMGDVLAQQGGSFAAIAAMADNAGMIFCTTLLELFSTSLLVITLLLMSPFGGEQKKRATFIPFCCGLEYKNYLIPKFVLYPAVLFVGNFLGGCLGGVLCNSLYKSNTADMGTILLGSMMCAIYAVFILTIYMALGICTGRPGIMVIVVYLGQTLVQLILSSLGLTRFNPFALYGFIAQGTLLDKAYVQQEIPSIIVSIVLAFVIMGLMYGMTFAALKAKQINNQEDKPEF